MGIAHKATQMQRTRRSSRSNSGCSGSDDESSTNSASFSHHLSKRLKTEPGHNHHGAMSNYVTTNGRLSFDVHTPINFIDHSRIYNNDNKKKPAELFRKDLISAMKMPDSEQLTESEYILITDPWKEEWEKGVQVPVNPDALPSASFRCVHEQQFDSNPSRTKGNSNNYTLKDKKGKDVQQQEDHQMPKEWIKDRQKPSEHLRYELDLIDLSWRELMTQTCLPPIAEHLIEDTITELERQCAENMKNNKIGIEFNDGVVCDVCRSPYSEEGNEMIFCDSCDVCVHQACYDIEEIPDGQWYCQPCKELGKSDKASCILCPNKRGAMKKTPEDTWAHVSCSLWVASQIDGDHKDSPVTDSDVKIGKLSRSSNKHTVKPQLKNRGYIYSARSNMKKPGPSEIVYRDMRFYIMDRPSDSTLPQLIDQFKKRNITDVIRVCEPSYRIDILTKNNIRVHDWQFDDGSPPPQEIIDKWFDLLRERYTEDKDCCIAVHCVAGLGRGPVMVAIALMELGMKYEDTIEYIRERRRGAFNQKQLKYLASYKSKSRLRSKKSGCLVI